MPLEHDTGAAAHARRVAIRSLPATPDLARTLLAAPVQGQLWPRGSPCPSPVSLSQRWETCGGQSDLTRALWADDDGSGAPVGKGRKGKRDVGMALAGTARTSAGTQGRPGGCLQAGGGERSRGPAGGPQLCLGPSGGPCPAPGLWGESIRTARPQVWRRPALPAPFPLSTCP